ncbi:hypothetical protein EZV62_001664 [Acer yangbiense]|uniref:Uncharacterized protein n=1 Tax=Acer yangbiense TaxID=1000413 RepID=A0A5C7IV77_9ROSI|nr:hypothetical protein EZV62_001664 [Acer yangbiense]
MEHHREAFVYVRHEMNDMKSTTTKSKAVMTRRLLVDEDKGDINERADAFIKNFHNQLWIQREESIKRCPEMISRGV